MSGDAPGERGAIDPTAECRSPNHGLRNPDIWRMRRWARSRSSPQHPHRSPSSPPQISVARGIQAFGACMPKRPTAQRHLPGRRHPHPPRRLLTFARLGRAKALETKRTALRLQCLAPRLPRPRPASRQPLQHRPCAATCPLLSRALDRLRHPAPPPDSLASASFRWSTCFGGSMSARRPKPKCPPRSKAPRPARITGLIEQEVQRILARWALRRLIAERQRIKMKSE